MRALRFLPIALALVIFGSAAPASANRSDPHCAIPHGWRIVAQDRQVVVMTHPRKRQLLPVWDYCNRSVGQRRFWFVGWSTGEQIRVAGRYLATRSGGNVFMQLVDTRTGQHRNFFDYGAGGQTDAGFLLSPNGVAAAIMVATPSGNPTDGGGDLFSSASVGILTMHTQAVLDSAYPQVVLQSPSNPVTQLANLKLYDCSGGCGAETTLVAWTHGGEQRYAQVAP